jgi:hypothetical protein
VGGDSTCTLTCVIGARVEVGLDPGPHRVHVAPGDDGVDHAVGAAVCTWGAERENRPSTVTTTCICPKFRPLTN